MKITQIEYIVEGGMGLKHHLKVIATDGGLEKALNYLKGANVISTTEAEVDSLKRYLGSSANRFVTYFMDGAKKEEQVKHYSTGTQYSVVYSWLKKAEKMNNENSVSLDLKSKLINQAIAEEDKLKKTLYSLSGLLSDTVSDIKSVTGADELAIDKEFVFVSKGNEQIEFCRNGSDGSISIDNQEDLDDFDWVVGDLASLLEQVKLIADIKEFLSEYRHIIGDDADYNE